MEFTELYKRVLRLKTLFLKTTSNGFSSRLIRRHDMLVGPLTLNNSLTTRLYAVFKVRIVHDLKLHHTGEQ